MLAHIYVYSVNNNLLLNTQFCAHCSRCCLCAWQQLVFRTICLWSCWCMKCGQVLVEVHTYGPIPKIKIPFSWNLWNIRKYSVGSQALFFWISCNFEIQDLLGIAPCRVANRYPHFGEAYCFLLHGTSVLIL